MIIQIDVETMMFVFGGCGFVMGAALMHLINSFRSCKVCEMNAPKPEPTAEEIAEKVQTWTLMIIKHRPIGSTKKEILQNWRFLSLNGNTVVDYYSTPRAPTIEKLDDILNALQDNNEVMQVKGVWYSV